MSTATELPPGASDGNPESKPGRVLLAGIALSSFAALLLELALTRLFSVVLFYHFAFLAISIALLGLGAGGVFAYLGKARLSKYETRKLVGWLCGASALFMPVLLTVRIADAGFATILQREFSAADRDLPDFGCAVFP